MTHRRPPRLPDIFYTGAHRVFFTMCTFERRNYFAELAAGEHARTHLLRLAAKADVEIIAYCFMPDHLHVLTEGNCEGADSRFYAARFRQLSGFHFKRSRSMRLWQEGYFDHVLRAEEATIAVVRYIVLNPVRAGLCVDASAYPLIGSSRHTLPELLTVTDWHPPLG